MGCILSLKYFFILPFFLRKYFHFFAEFLYLSFSTQTMHIKSIVHNSIGITSQKTYTLSGLEPGSSVPEENCDADCATPPGHFQNLNIGSV
jgi:hypothetical protein